MISAGEFRKGVTFEDEIYGPEFRPLSNALKKLHLEPFVICESAGTQDIDAIKMQKIYFGDWLMLKNLLK